MNIVKGFYSVPKLSNNNNKTTAVFGELSQYANSFSKDFKTFTKGNSQVNLCVFSCKDNNTKVELGQVYAELANTIGDLAYSVGGSFPSNGSKDDFIQIINNALTTQVKLVSCGDLITDGSFRLPKWISWETNLQATPHKYKIWLSAVDFEENYDEFEISVVPPVDRIDKLFQPYPELMIELSLNDMFVLHNRVSTVRDRCPETILYTEMVELIDLTNVANRPKIGWTVLIYGPAGNTTDNIKEAIRSYIATNSTSTENDWRALMPDLFSTTCFFVYPRWDKFAVEPRLALPGIYSPVLTVMQNFNFVKSKTSSFISEAHLIANLQTTIHRYKDISLNIVGGEFNKLNLFKFTDYFGDYNAQSSLNEDFNRQSQPTKEITNLLTFMLKKIDGFEKDSSLPVTAKVVIKYGQKFLVSKYNGIEYLVQMKPSQQP